MTEKRYKSIGTNLECSNGMEYMLIKRNDGFNVCQVCSKYTAKEIVDELNSLADENEQLKQQIQQLQHWNNCLAEKRHQELSYKPYTASKSEKELKELLEPKLFNCGDR